MPQDPWHVMHPPLLLVTWEVEKKDKVNKKGAKGRLGGWCSSKWQKFHSQSPILVCITTTLASYNPCAKQNEGCHATPRLALLWHEYVPTIRRI